MIKFDAKDMSKRIYKSQVIPCKMHLSLQVLECDLQPRMAMLRVMYVPAYKHKHSLGMAYVNVKVKTWLQGGLANETCSRVKTFSDKRKRKDGRLRSSLYICYSSKGFEGCREGL